MTYEEGLEEDFEESFLKIPADIFPHLIRVERDDYRLPKTYAVRESFLFKNIFCIEREKYLILIFESGLDDPMKMENDNIKC